MLEFKSPYSHPNYRPDIDGLRAVAVLSVVIFHAFPTALSGGFIGVDIFFVISGYLITTILISNKNEFSFIDFYARRIKRIFPALLLVLISVFIVGWALLLKSEFLQLNSHVTAGSLFFSNFQLLSEVDYFDAKSETKPLLHLWSLAIEEQFYIFWPVILWAGFKSRVSSLIIISLLAIWSFNINIGLTFTDKMEAFYLPQSRVWELLSGGALAWISIFLKKQSAEGFHINRIVTLLCANIMSFAGAALLCYSLTTLSAESAFPGYLASLPVAGAMLLIAAGPNALINRILLANKISIWVGLISFPLYLWHWPILSFISILTDNGASYYLKFTAVLASLLLAWLTFKFIELPIRRKRGITYHIPLLAIGMLAIAAFSFFASARLYNHYWENSSKIRLETTAAFSPKRKECHLPPHAGFEKIAACEYFDNTNKQVAVFGNSHATELAYALALQLKPKGVGVKHYTMSGCMTPKIVDGKYENSVCNDWQMYSVNKIANDPDINYVIVSYRVETFLFEPGYKEGFKLLIDKLSNSGKKIILVMQAPKIDHYINYYVRYSLAGMDVKSVKLADWKALNKDQYSFIKALPKDITVVDPADAFCDTKNCYAIRNNTSLYFDDNHMSVAGASMVAEKIDPLIVKSIMN